MRASARVRGPPNNSKRVNRISHATHSHASSTGDYANFPPRSHYLFRPAAAGQGRRPTFSPEGARPKTLRKINLLIMKNIFWKFQRGRLLVFDFFHNMFNNHFLHYLIHYQNMTISIFIR